MFFLAAAFSFDFLCVSIFYNLIRQIKRIQSSGAQNRCKKKLREAEDNAMRDYLDVWVKKQHVANDQSDADYHEPVAAV